MTKKILYVPSEACDIRMLKNLNSTDEKNRICIKGLSDRIDRNKDNNYT
jgi:hypothetical protein